MREGSEEGEKLIAKGKLSRSTICWKEGEELCFML